LEHYGTSVPDIRSVTKTVSRELAPITHADLVKVAADLWRPPVHERRMAAVELLEQNQKALRPADIKLLERLLRESRTWALVDSLSASVVGPLVERNPALVKVLDRWAHDDDFWIRRSALLALLGGLRHGAGDFDRFSQYADAMLDEKEFFIRKAIGWVLREVSKKRPDLVRDFVTAHGDQMSGLTKREAMKYVPALRTARRARAPGPRRRAP
jgi:3-methyladenine DNA glycosylase AlkD